MHKFFIALILIIGTYVVYNYYNPPRSAMVLSVPVHTLKRLGFNDGNLPFKLSSNISCNDTVGSQNFTMMFGKRMERKTWNQHVVLYLAWQDILQLTDQIYLCLPFKGKLEPVWSGQFNLLGTFNLYIMHKSFFCNKKNSDSKWECSGYESHKIKIEEASKLLTKYSEIPLPNKIINKDKVPIKANLRGKITEYGVYDKLKKSLVSAENRLLNQDEYKLLNATNKVKAIKNQGFGFRYEIRKYSSYAENDFKLIIHHPPIVNEKGIRLNKTEWINTLPSDYGIFESEFLYFFDHEYEMVSGIWKFQIIDRDKILLEKEFYVSL